jgi:phosphoribosylformylglycinamidine (FGAM) synthase-like enzyme
LLVAIHPDHTEDFETFCLKHELTMDSFGTITEKKEKTIYVV